MLPLALAPHCGSLAYLRCHRYAYSCLHYSLTRLLQLTLCWPPSWALTVPGQGPSKRTKAKKARRTPKCGHVSSSMQDVVHWLPLQQRISYLIISLVWRPLLDIAPAYLRDLCCITMGIPGRRSIPTERGFLIVPFVHTTTKQWLAIRTGDELSLLRRLFPRILSRSFNAHLNRFLFS